MTHCRSALMGTCLLCCLGINEAITQETRVSPPSWWSAAESQMVTLLIEGKSLKSARLEPMPGGVEILGIELSGDAMFVDLRLAANVEPGERTLRIESKGKTATIPWRIEPKSSYKPKTIGSDDVIYLIMPDRFANGNPRNDTAENVEKMLDRRNPHAYHGGDFAGLKAKLPYLADLGVTALWLTPVYKPAPKWFYTTVNGQPRKFADFHGYSPVDFFDTNPRFGTKDEYRALVDEAHRLGLKVIQDQIVGYTGPQHLWVTNPPAPDWFHGPMDKPPACNFRFDAQVNPHALESDRRGLTDGWFFGILPDLNTRHERVKRFAIQESLWWANRFAADGIRLDTYPMVDRAFWRDWSKAQKRYHPDLRAIGEAWVIDAPDLSFFQGGRAGWDGIDPGIESVFDFPLNFALVDVLSNTASATKLAKALSRDFLFPRPNLLVTFLDNHDTPRLATAAKVTPSRYRLAAAFLLTTRGIPQLTWGDEIGMGGHSDDRREIPGGWPEDSRDAFRAQGRTPEEQATFATFQSLLTLRKASAALRNGTTTELAATDSVFAYLREDGAEKVVVVLNFGEIPAQVTLPKDVISAALAYERIHGDGTLMTKSEKVIADIPGERAGVFRNRTGR